MGIKNLAKKREQTRAGLAAARTRGRKGGRPRKMTKTILRMAMTAMADQKSIAADVAKRLGITTTRGLSSNGAIGLSGRSV